MAASNDGNGKSGKDQYFRRGEVYSRKVISEHLGGSHIPFAPTVKGRVKCICLDPARNPLAPEKVFVGSGPGIERMAKQVAEQKGPFPTFLKQAPGSWEYLGRFQIRDYSANSREFDRFYKPCKTPRDELTGILFLTAD